MNSLERGCWCGTEACVADDFWMWCVVDCLWLMFVFVWMLDLMENPVGWFLTIMCVDVSLWCLGTVPTCLFVVVAHLLTLVPGGCYTSWQINSIVLIGDLWIQQCLMESVMMVNEVSETSSIWMLLIAICLFCVEIVLYLNNMRTCLLNSVWKHTSCSRISLTADVFQHVCFDEKFSWHILVCHCECTSGIINHLDDRKCACTCVEQSWLWWYVVQFLFNGQLKMKQLDSASVYEQYELGQKLFLSIGCLCLPLLKSHAAYFRFFFSWYWFVMTLYEFSIAANI